MEAVLLEASDDQEEFAAQGSSDDDSEDDGGALQLGNVTEERRERQPEPPAPLGGVGGQVLQVKTPGSCPADQRLLPPLLPPLAPAPRRSPPPLLPPRAHHQLPTFEFASKRKQRQDPGRPLLLFDINGVLMQHTWNGTAHVVRGPAVWAWLSGLAASGRCCFACIAATACLSFNSSCLADAQTGRPDPAARLPARPRPARPCSTTCARACTSCCGWPPPSGWASTPQPRGPPSPRRWPSCTETWPTLWSSGGLLQRGAVPPRAPAPAPAAAAAARRSRRLAQQRRQRLRLRRGAQRRAWMVRASRWRCRPACLRWSWRETTAFLRPRWVPAACLLGWAGCWLLGAERWAIQRSQTHRWLLCAVRSNLLNRTPC